MDRSEVFKYIPIFVMFTWQMVVAFLFRSWVLRYAFNMVGMVICISFLVVTNQVLKWQAAEYRHIEAVCRPSDTKMHIFYEGQPETVEIEPGIFASKISLAVTLPHSFYGPVEKGGSLVLKHWGDWEARMIPGKGKAIFKGQVIEHANSCRVVLHEPYDTFDMDHLNPIPIFELKDAPGDYNLPEDEHEISQVAGGMMKTFYIEGKTITGTEMLFAYRNLKKDNEHLKTRNVELQRQGLSWHQEAVRLEEVNKQIKNELHSVLSSKGDMKQAVVEQVLTGLEAHTDIHSFWKTLRPTTWLSKAVAILILGVMAMGIFLTNPGGVMEWISVGRNQLFIIILVAAAVGVYVWVMQKRGR